MLGDEAGHPLAFCIECKCTFELCSTLCMWRATAGLFKEYDLLQNTDIKVVLCNGHTGTVLREIEDKKMLVKKRVS